MGFQESDDPSFPKRRGNGFLTGIKTDIDRDDQSVPEINLSDLLPILEVAFFIDVFKVASGQRPVEPATEGRRRSRCNSYEDKRQAYHRCLLVKLRLFIHRPKDSMTAGSFRYP